MADISDDIMIFETEEGGALRAQFMDSIFYNGDEYAILAALPDGAATADDVEDDELEIFFMKMVPTDDDNVEYVPIEDDELSDELYEIVNQAYEDELDDEYDDDEPDDGEA